MDIKRVPYADIHSNNAHISLAIIVNLIMTMSYIFQNIKLICFSFRKKTNAGKKLQKRKVVGRAVFGFVSIYYIC